MTSDREDAGPAGGPPPSERLCAVIEAEREALGQLLALSRSQATWMRAGDVPELQRCTARWRPALQAVEAARRARVAMGPELERALEWELNAARGWRGGPVGDEPGDGPLGRALSALAATAADLGRQNARNQALAGFCLDLVRHQSEIFRRCLLEDPAGRYGGDAGRTAAPPGGVVARQA